LEGADESKFAKLRKFNIAMGTLHAIQGVIMLILSLSNKASADVYLTLWKYNDATRELYQQTDVIGSLPLGPMVAMFLFASAVAHFSVSSPQGYPWYVANLKKGINYARWLEYAVSSSIMVIVIAVLCGITELGALIVIFCLNATMNLFGLMMELHNQTTKKTNWTAFILGSFAGLMVWITMGIYFFGSLLGSTDSIPTFVYAIFFILAIFFNIFALNMVLQYRAKGKWKDYLYGEKVYIVLSLSAKTALAWLVWGGTARF
jgi:hypothetical protein